MKRGVIVALAIAVGILLALIAIPALRHPLKSLSVPTITPLPSFTPTPTQIVGVPITIKIPTIGVEASIEPVTVDSNGNMDVPKDPMETAWYSRGSRPGQNGSAVIDGHVDTPTGARAVFARINELRKGNRIEVISADNVTTTFIVQSVHSYPLATIPLEKIFDTNIAEKRLNLITCGGIWDKNKKIYTERIVVFSVAD